MKIQKLKYITFFIIATFFSNCGSETSESGESMISFELDSLSFDEMKETVLKESAYLSMLVRFWGDDTKPKSYEDSEESVEKEFTLPQPFTLYDFKKELSVTQTLDFPNSNLSLKEMKEDESSDINYKLKTIYYKDGSTENVDKWISSGEYIINKMQPVDSVRISIEYTYTTKLVKLQLSEAAKTIDYKGGTIKLTEFDKNYVQYVMDDTISNRFIEAQAITRVGNVVGTGATVSGGLTPEEQSAYFKKIEKKLNGISEKIKGGMYKSKEDLIADLKKAAAETRKKDTKQYYRSEYYHGNVSTVLLYFSDEEQTDEYSLVIPVRAEVGDFNIIEKNDLYGIVDSDGNVILDAKQKNLTAINSYYYSSVDYYNSRLLHLNPNTKKLDTIKQYKPENVSYLTNDLVSVYYRHKYGVLDKNGSMLVAPLYSDIKTDADNRLIVARGRDEVVVYNLSLEKIYSGKGHLDSFNDGFALMRGANDKYAFIGENGKVLDMSQYSYVAPFAEEFAVVSKNGKYGFINKSGNVVIPLIYDDVKEFMQGITMVEVDNMRGLINKKNEFVVPLTESSGFGGYSGGSDGRTYWFGGNKYDTSGKLIGSDKEE